MRVPDGSAVYYLLACFLLTEYGIKHWWENQDRLLQAQSPLTYVLFRVLHFAVNFAALALLFDLGPLRGAAAWTLAAMELLASTELLVSLVERTVLSRWGIRLRWLHLLPLAAATIYPAAQDLPFAPSSLMESAYAALSDTFRGFSMDMRETGMWALAYAALAYPCNHIVRCLIDKRTDRFVADAVVARTARRSARPAGNGIPAATGISDPVAAVHDESAAALEGLAGATAKEGAPASASVTARHEPRPAAAAQAPRVAMPDEARTLRAGRTIGILERWIVTTLVVIGQFGLVGLVLAAKSVARFKRLEEEEFAEYYILGTLYSLLLALFAGVVLTHAA